MAKLRRRRIVVAPVLAFLSVGVLTAWMQFREAPEIQRSRPLRIGMTEAEIEAVMGESQHGRVERYAGDYRITMYFGRLQERRYHVYDAIRSWTGDRLPAWSIAHEHWPVRVRFNRRPGMGGRVDRIERGDEIEEAAVSQ